jgi:hypothetical protein
MGTTRGRRRSVRGGISKLSQLRSFLSFQVPTACQPSLSCLKQHVINHSTEPQTASNLLNLQILDAQAESNKRFMHFTPRLRWQLDMCGDFHVRG